MIELNINEMTDEEIEMYLERYRTIFQRVLKEIIEEEASLEKIWGSKLTLLNQSKEGPLSVFLSLVKKVVKNTFISVLTGIEPMHLDNDTSAIRRKGYNFYMRQDLARLIFTSCTRLKEETQNFLQAITATDAKTKRKISAKMDSFFRETYGVDYGSGKKYRNGDNPVYGLPLAVFLSSVMGKEDLYDLLHASWDRGVAVGTEYDFLKDCYEPYSFLQK